MLLAFKIEEGPPRPRNICISERWKKQENRFSHRASRRNTDLLISWLSVQQQFGLLISWIVVLCHSINRKRIQPWILICIVVRSDNIPGFNRSFKFIKTCFMTHNMVCLGKWDLGTSVSAGQAVGCSGLLQPH